MDAKRFDVMTKALTSVPRRRLLGAVAACTLGSLVGFGGSFVNRGSKASQRSSGTSDDAFMARHHGSPPRFCNTVLVRNAR